MALSSTLLSQTAAMYVVSEFLPPAASIGANKRKRRPPGTPDPGAEVVALSPKALMESQRYVCEECNQGFKRDQNLQMHRRRHKVPWKLLKKPGVGTHKRVYICPERSCLHHNPTHALGDLVGIKKHYRRKHCTEKQWKCVKCSKGYAVQSDYNAHLKTCGTRGHCCDCGRIFSRVESFIEHQNTCGAVKLRSMQPGSATGRKPAVQHQVPDGTSRNSSSQSSDTTKAMSFLQSGMSNAAARSADSIHIIPGTAADNNRNSRRIESSQQTSNAVCNAAMPAWLMNVHMDRNNKLEPLQRFKHQQRPSPTFAATSEFPGVRRLMVEPGSSSMTQLTCCNSSIYSTRPELSFASADAEDADTPSLQLSIGPSKGGTFRSPPAEAVVDAKPSFRSVDREVLAFAFNQKHGNCSAGQTSPLGIPRICVTGNRVLGNDLALSIPENRNLGTSGSGTEAVNSLSAFLVQASRRIGTPSSNAVAFHQSENQMLSRNLEMLANGTLHAAGRNSSCHEDRAGKCQDLGPLGLKVAWRNRKTAGHHSRLEPDASMVSSRQDMDHMDVVETDRRFFAASQSSGHKSLRSQNQMAKARVEASEVRTDTNMTRSDLARQARRQDISNPSIKRVAGSTKRSSSSPEQTVSNEQPKNSSNEHRRLGLTPKPSLQTLKRNAFELKPSRKRASSFNKVVVERFPRPRPEVLSLVQIGSSTVTGRARGPLTEGDRSTRICPP